MDLHKDLEVKYINNNRQFAIYKNANEVLEEHFQTKKRLIIYRNDVYDVGRYLDQLGHPGEEAILKPFYGRDATIQMHKLKHSNTAYKILQSYKVGEI